MLSLRSSTELTYETSLLLFLLFLPPPPPPHPSVLSTSFTLIHSSPSADSRTRSITFLPAFYGPALQTMRHLQTMDSPEVSSLLSATDRFFVCVPGNGNHKRHQLATRIPEPSRPYLEFLPVSRAWASDSVNRWL